MTTKQTGGSAKVSANDRAAFCTAALTKVGVSDADARTTADVLVTTDAWGVFTHGVKGLRGYVRRLRAGGLGPTPARKCRLRPCLGRRGRRFGPRHGHVGFRHAHGDGQGARCGVGYCGVRNSCHFGAAGYYVAWPPPRT